MKSTTANLTTTGATPATGIAALTKPDTDTLTIVQLSGTYGTVTGVIEGTLDGTNWFGLSAVTMALGTIVTSTLSPSDNSTIAWAVPSAGLIGVRFRCTAIASGTAAIALQSSTYVGQVYNTGG
jgi:hypothetical protein